MDANFPKAFLKYVVSELNAEDMEARYDSMLDECYDFSSVGGPFSHMQASRVLAEMDPVAYRCGKNDYADGESDQFYEIEDEWYDVREVDDLYDDWKAENVVTCKHCGSDIHADDHGTWIDDTDGDVCTENNDGAHVPEGDDDTEDDDACPGCGCKPGDGVTEDCNDPNGCGYFKANAPKE